MNDRKKPLETANTMGQLIKKVRKAGYKVRKKPKGGHWHEPGRDKQRFTPYD